METKETHNKDKKEEDEETEQEKNSESLNRRREKTDDGKTKGNESTARIRRGKRDKKELDVIITKSPETVKDESLLV
ncbi:hypothetical protein E2C01_043070 [Portunus trituberculatus]|uniref:Uncharacterized protein n=1 Tax=Portunus trituberculatus TaxID=210409 RepID=A0A5B7FRX5_PORTR|nr:hypothetical protein [Portunus trituberculatus]